MLTICCLSINITIRIPIQCKVFDRVCVCLYCWKSTNHPIIAKKIQWNRWEIDYPYANAHIPHIYTGAIFMLTERRKILKNRPISNNRLLHAPSPYIYRDKFVRRYGWRVPHFLFSPYIWYIFPLASSRLYTIRWSGRIEESRVIKARPFFYYGCCQFVSSSLRVSFILFVCIHTNIFCLICISSIDGVW